MAKQRDTLRTFLGLCGAITLIFFSISSSVQALDDPQSSQNENSVIRIALPEQSAIEANPSGEFQLLVNFLREFWQIWSIDQKIDIEFIFMPTAQTKQALANKEIDIAAISIIEQDEINLLYSVPYAKFQQHIYRRLNSNVIDGMQIGIHSSTNSTLAYLGQHIEKSYFENIDDLFKDQEKFDVLYSTQPWLLTEKIIDYNLNTQFQISTDEVPEIYLHFAAHADNRQLMLLINDSLRAVNKIQTQLWTEKYLKTDRAKISLTLGNYIQELSNEEKEYILDNNHLVFSVLSEGFPPFVITKSFSNLTERGLTIDLLDISSKRTGIIYKPIYVDNLDQAIDALKKQVVNLFIHIEKTSERSKDYLFSAPYLNANYAIAHRHDHPTPNDFLGLSDRTFAVVDNFNVTRLLKEKLPNAKYKSYSTVVEAITSVSYGETDVFLGSALGTSYLIKQNQLSNLISKPVTNFNENALISFATSHQTPTLITLMNRTLKDITSNEFDDLYAKWSKTAFPEINSEEEVATAYRNARNLFAGIMFFGLMIFWIYYRQLRMRKIAQQKVEHALSLAEIARADAEKSAQAKITFLARMSHEIRTPMNGVLGMAEAMAFTPLNKEQQELLEMLQGSARNLLALLNDVLDFSKMDAGKLTLEFVPVNFHLLCKNIISGFNHIEHDDDLAINLIVDESITHSYYTDPTRITQVLNNLISNAIKFTEKGAITLEVKRLESRDNMNNTYDTLQFDVQDTGIGIAREKQSMLFTPFIQADDEVTRKFGGTGLGLSICQEIVTSMGSEIKLDSVPEQGSNFHFTLILKQAGLENENDDRRKNKRMINAPDDDRFKSLRVLIAEDNLVNVKVLSAQLSRLNITPDIAYDGQEALDLHHKAPYDIIISDCHMPNLDGFELAKILTKERAEKNQHFWLIAVTADALSGAAEACTNAGFDDYMAKPCPQEEITNKLNNAYRQVVNKSCHHAPKPNMFKQFNLTALLKTNEQDIELSKNIAEIFISLWQEEKKHWLDAINRNDGKALKTIAHKVKGGVRLLANKPLISQLENINQTIPHSKDITAERHRKILDDTFIQLELLSDEISDWLQK